MLSVFHKALHDPWVVITLFVIALFSQEGRPNVGGSWSLITQVQVYLATDLNNSHGLDPAGEDLEFRTFRYVGL